MTRIAELKNYLREKTSAGVALAFSGGVDSSFLLAVLKELCDEKPFPLQALNMRTVFLREDEIAEARQTASSCGVPLAEFTCDPLSLPQLRNNPADRCYWCKRHIFSVFKDHAEKKHLEVIMDGTNGDDLHVYRPGRKALRELGVVSPLAELGFTKAEIRKLAAERGLKCAKKPAMPCLATRFAYGTELTPERILQDVLRQLWMEAVRRRQGALPAESTPENDLQRLNYSTCIRRLQRDSWNKASALMTPDVLA